MGTAATIAGILAGLLALTGIVILASSIRARFAWEDAGPRLFLGLGWAGVDLDLRRRERRWRVFGRPAGRARSTVTPEEEADEPGDADGGWSWNPTTIATRFRLLRDCAGPLLRFTAAVGRAIRLEELEAEVRAGFADPALTGCAVGAHAALAGAVPGVGRRLHYQPDWTGASFRARGRVALALPVWRLASALVVLAWRLPLRRVWRAVKTTGERSE